MSNAIDRPGAAFAKGTYAIAKKYVDGDGNEAGACAEAGVGKAHAEWSVYDAEAKGPNASAGVTANEESLGHVSLRAGGEISAGTSKLLSIHDIERSGRTFARGPYANAKMYEGGCENKIGVYAEAGVGQVCAEWDDFYVEAKGPNASAGFAISEKSLDTFARAEVASVSASEGPLKATVGLGVDTGYHLGSDGVEVELLGTGITLGERPSISVLGSSVECSIS